MSLRSSYDPYQMMMMMVMTTTTMMMMIMMMMMKMTLEKACRRPHRIFCVEADQVSQSDNYGRDYRHTSDADYCDVFDHDDDDSMILTITVMIVVTPVMMIVVDDDNDDNYHDGVGDHLCDGGVPEADWLNHHHVKLHLHL